MSTPNSVFVANGLVVCAEPEFVYTPTGAPVLKVRCLTDRWVSGTGENKTVQTIPVRITIWRDQAEFTASLLREFINRDSNKAPGVGARINVFANQMPYVSFWFPKDRDTGEIQYGVDGNPRVNVTLEVTAYKIEVASALPDGAYQRAAKASKSGRLPGSSQAGTEEIDGESIPF